jgi:serine/threonine-protein kinase
MVLGSCEILDLIGKGGMGEVYRGRDMKLGREVAVKSLPEVFAHDTERLTRFEREAQVLASLNHPNIAAIYELKELHDSKYLVLELVEGETLAERLQRGPLPLEEALDLALQIADALEAAHEKGIVHRDLKPANVKVTPGGRVKVLDFGLAKINESASASTNLSNSPTLSAIQSAAGIILGTAAYMSPEQARGKAVDKRADVWAFGCIIYEMITGRQAFPNGETVSDTLAGILAREPDWPALPATIPLKLRMLLERCLRKDARHRLHDIADARIELEEARHEAPIIPANDGKAIPSRRREYVLGVVALLLLITLGAVTYLLRISPAATPSVRFAFTVPKGERFGDGAGLALSPDGSRLVYQAFNERGVSGLYVRAVDSFESQPLAGGERGTLPFLSPDGQWVGFFADRKLKKIPVAGGAPIEICDAPNPRGGSWGTDGTIIFTPNFPSGLSRVSANGGSVTPVTTLANQLDRHNWPEVLPGARAVVFSQTVTGNWDEGNIVALSLDTGERRVLVHGGTHARYTPAGYLIFARAGNLMAIPFDPSRLGVTGGALRIVEGVQNTVVTGSAQFSISKSGALAYVPGTLNQDLRTLVWVDRKGIARSVGTHPAQSYSSVHLSPDGSRIVVSVGVVGNQTDVWVYDIARTILTRLTSDFDNVFPIWTTDGKRVIYWRRRQAGSIFWRAADGSGNEERVYEHNRQNTTATGLGSWSPDGRVLVFTIGDPVKGSDIWSLSLDGDRKPKPVIQTQFTEGQSALSPDGRWLAYTSNSSGRNEVYVQPFPDLAAKWQISAEGGNEPKWAPNGRELFYRIGDKMMLVDVRTQPNFQPQPARILFEGIYVAGTGSYVVAPDGQHFLMIKQDQSSTFLTEARVVLGWAEELKHRTANN